MADSLFDDLAAPWRRAFGEAWASFQAGNFGIGAVLVDPVDGSPVAAGRNRVAQHRHEPRTLSGNMTAHAEMNAFAALDQFNADGLHLYTTLEPCLMCAATAMQLKVAHIHFAAADEFYIGMNELWPQFALTAERQPTSTGPLPDTLARFARLLPLAFTTSRMAGGNADALARQHHPELAALADSLADDTEFDDIFEGGTVVDAVAYLASRLDF